MDHHQDSALPDGYFYHNQIIGLQVVTTGGEALGIITGILSGESNDNYIVAGASGEILIPAIEDVIISIDLNRQMMVIEPMEGLLDLNEKKPPNKPAA